MVETINVRPSNTKRVRLQTARARAQQMSLQACIAIIQRCQLLYQLPMANMSDATGANHAVVIAG